MPGPYLEEKRKENRTSEMEKEEKESRHVDVCEEEHASRAWVVGALRLGDDAFGLSQNSLSNVFISLSHAIATPLPSSLPLNTV